MHAVAEPLAREASPSLDAAASERPVPTPSCCICGQPVSGWLPHPHRERRSEFMKLMDTVGSDLSVYQCPACGCNDRDRHLWLYMGAVGITARVAGARVLHIAPEPRLEMLLSALKPATYVRGDLRPQRPGHVAIDVEAMSFADASFDLVVCNHVLEHVADPHRALHELHRCLVPGGLLIAQTPYSPRLKQTFEVNTPVEPDFAQYFYGQEDHVRLFGMDLFDLFGAVGFKGKPLAHEAVLAGIDPLLAGCNAREPFFVFFK